MRSPHYYYYYSVKNPNSKDSGRNEHQCGQARTVQGLSADELQRASARWRPHFPHSTHGQRCRSTHAHPAEGVGWSLTSAKSMSIAFTARTLNV